MRGGRRVLAAAMGALLLLAACDSVEERVEKHYRRGIELVEAGELAKATIEFRNALKLDENHPGARYQIGLAYERDGELRAALGNFALAAELDPNNLDVRLKLGQFYLLGNNIEQAGRVIAEAAALDPENVEVMALQAALLFRQENPAAALDRAQAALAVDPQHVGAAMIVASALYAEGNIDGALGELDKIIGHTPTARAAHLLKARILEAEGRSDALLAQLAEMVRLFPEERAYRQTLIVQQTRAGALDDAEAGLRALVADNPGDRTLALDLARFVGSRQGAEAGRAELEKILTAVTDPAVRAGLQVTLAQVDIGLGETDRARALLEGVIADSTAGDARNDARLVLARIETSAENIAAARTLIDTVIEADPRNPDALALRASLNLRDENPGAAIIDLRTASAAAPENVEIMLLMARAYERNGSPDLALDRLAAATRVSDYDPRIALTYANALNGRGDSNAALTVLRETDRRHAQNETVLAALGQQFIRLEDWDNARKTADALSALQGDDTTSRRVEAASLAAAGQLSESIGLLRELVDGSDNAGAAVAQLVSTLARAGELDQAEAVVADVLAREPGNNSAALMKAELRLARNDEPGARAALQSILDTDPGSPVGYAALARLDMATGNHAAAEAVLTRGIDAAENDDSLRMMMAELLERRGDIDGALGHYETLYESQPGSVVVANNYAALLAQYRADDPKAVAHAQRIAQRLRASTVPEFQDTYGWLQYLAGNYEAALRSLQPAAAARPQNPWIRFHTGMAFAAIDRAAEAREHLEAALAIDPGFPKADEARTAIASLPAGN